MIITYACVCDCVCPSICVSVTAVTVCQSDYVFACRDDYKFAEMISQKPSVAILSLDLVRHPYIALER